MVNAELLEILACPEDKSPVRLADAGLLEKLNDRVRAGSLVNRGGQPVTEPLAEALVRADGRYVYAVRDGIPIMLVEEGIPVEGA
jgi:uncharacterized protein YbaR (Trm112 family)